MKKYFAYIVCFIFCFGVATELFAQNKYKTVRKGNRRYNNSSFEEAEEFYGKALAKDSTYAKAQYNLGNTLYKQNCYEDALKYYSEAINSDDKKMKEDALFNSGNTYLKKAIDEMQKGEQSDAVNKAIDSYINVLKDNPKHEDAKYNLAYSLQLLNQMEQNQNQQGDGEQDDNKDQEDQKQNQQQQNQQKEQQDNKQEQKERENQTKKSDAERILEAMKENEKKIMERQKVKVKGAKVEKDW